MTGWLLAFGWRWALVPVLVWLARGVWIANTQPRLTFVMYSMVSTEASTGRKGSVAALLTVKRRERLPPWRLLDEVWLVSNDVATRESDGLTLDSLSTLLAQLKGMVFVARARESETESVLKERGGAS